MQTAPARSGPERILYLDSLRGLAALTISLLWHYQHFFGPGQSGLPEIDACPWWNIWPAWALFQVSQLAVDFFFVLSGIVFSHVYWERVRDRKISASVFFRRRFARLYPIHFATLILTAWLVWGFHGVAHRWPIDPQDQGINDVAGFLENLLFLQGGFFPPTGYNSPAWSLTIEEMMYVAFFLQARWDARSWLPAALLILGFTIFVHPGPEVMLINKQVARGLMGFSAGMLLYRHAPRLPRPRWLEIWPLVWLGDLSLTIYMIHVPIQMLMIIGFWAIGLPLPVASWGLWLLYATLVLAVSDLVRTWYVEPMRQMLRA